MYEDADLEAGVKAGLLSPESADALRNLVATRRGMSAADEERFGFAGLADLMTSVALLLVLGGGLILLTMTVGPLSVAGLALAAWGLAERYTRKRQLTLTSFVLFGMFALAWTMCCFAVSLMLPGPAITETAPDAALATITPLRGLLTACGTTMGCVAFWLRFRLPIAYAAAVVAGLNTSMHVLRLILPDAPAWAVSTFLLAAGFVIFLLAMWWDMSDIRRQTRRADVAFWLHAAAGFQIAGACFRMLIGLESRPDGWDRLYSFTIGDFDAATAVGALLLFGAFCFLALAIDRRSILMSSLAFVVPALAFVTGTTDMTAWLMSGMLVGFFLLAVATRWPAMRRTLLAALPTPIRAQLPRTELMMVGARPVR